MQFTPWTIAFAVVFLLLASLVYVGRRGSTVSVLRPWRRAVESEVPAVCPHLGIVDDPHTHHSQPSEDHRCYLWWVQWMQLRDELEQLRVHAPTQRSTVSQDEGSNQWWTQWTQRHGIDLARQEGFCLSVNHRRCPWLILGASEQTRVGSGRLEVSGVTAALGAAVVPTLKVGGEVAEELGWRSAAGLRRLAALMRTWLPILGSHAVAATRHMGSWTVLALLWIKRGILAAAVAVRAALHERRPGEVSAPALESMAATSNGQSAKQAVAAAVSPSVTSEANVPTLVSPDIERLIADGKTASIAGNRVQAYAYFAQAVELDSTNQEAWLWKAAMSDLTEEKKFCMERALALDTARTGTLESMEQLAPAQTGETADISLLEQGLAALQNGNEDQAYRLFVMATELDARNGKAWFWRAKTATTLDELISCLEHALDVDPNDETVKANLIWARERLAKEQRSQPMTAGAGGSQGFGTLVTPFPAPHAAYREKPAPGLLRLIPGGASLLLAIYWLWGALVPVAGMPSLPWAEELALLMPFFTFSDTTVYPRYEIVTGYNLLDAAPYAVGFLFLFLARALVERERWTLLWGVVLAIGTLFCALRFVDSSGATAVGTALSGVLAVGLLLSRRELVVEE